MAAEPGSRGRIIVFGILFWYPLAGVTYQFLHYLLALRRLGYDAVLHRGLRPLGLRPDAERPVAGCQPATSPRWRRVLDAHGFAGRWAFRGDYPGRPVLRHDRGRRSCTLYREADAFLNVTGAQEIREEHLQCPRRIYVESDPFASQVKVANGDDRDHRRARRARHALHVRREHRPARLRHPGDPLPLAADAPAGAGRPVAQHAQKATGAPYTTITTWHNKGKDVVYNGDRYYWTKDREFEHFLDLPRAAPWPVRAGGRRRRRHTAAAHRPRLAAALVGRSVGQRRPATATTSSSSRGEFTVARDQYVRPKTGWFSDRTACYLAAGRPVITQDTGFGKFLPTGRGLFAFTTMDDVLAAIDAIESDYEGHSKAAQEIADEYFGAERVVESLLARAGL